MVEDRGVPLLGAPFWPRAARCRAPNTCKSAKIQRGRVVTPWALTAVSSDTSGVGLSSPSSTGLSWGVSGRSPPLKRTHRLERTDRDWGPADLSIAPSGWKVSAGYPEDQSPALRRRRQVLDIRCLGECEEGRCGAQNGPLWAESQAHGNKSIIDLPQTKIHK